MAHVVINSYGTGAAQAGGAVTMVNVKTAHGTSAQTDERVYMYHKV